LFPTGGFGLASLLEYFSFSWSRPLKRFTS